MAIAALEENIEQPIFSSWDAKSGSPQQFDRPTIKEFEHLYISYRPRVWSLCLRMTGNPDDAEDLTQETFIRMFQKLDTYRGESAFCTWLRRITINVVLLRFQKASRRKEIPMEELGSPEAISGCPREREFGKSDSRLREAVDRINLQRALQQLPPGFKTVLLLHDIEGYEHVEISKLMGCSIGTSKSQLHKARLKMRDLLEHGQHEKPATQVSKANCVPSKSDGRGQAAWQHPPRMCQRSAAVASRAA